MKPGEGVRGAWIPRTALLAVYAIEFRLDRQENMLIGKRYADTHQKN